MILVRMYMIGKSNVIAMSYDAGPYGSMSKVQFCANVNVKISNFNVEN